MYKTLTKKILDLRVEVKLENSGLEKIQNKIKKYELERIKIRSMFPENFFNSYSVEE
ncbi:MAG TPA: hypothetical protein VIH04_00180 [Nitrosarchaeum sp.]